MKTARKENFLLIENDADSLTDFSSELTKHHDDIKNENVVVYLLDHKDIEANSLLGFLEISNFHRSHNKSFVIVNDSVGIDELPDELVVVPSLQEAEDMVQMDEIQRDLGF
ncbi:ribonuclease Z [Christiangramia crocea]|uniref:Ribonuclease Z n=1 Tax=Christiangramia crocea TaxID=2904124 RepID=A0A9X1UX38_9FLAO|nr:ribonuclease Z [Gramella crocea]MCG9972007.1 ribonuclease Z [Gramella crocea]